MARAMPSERDVSFLMVVATGKGSKEKRADKEPLGKEAKANVATAEKGADASHCERLDGCKSKVHGTLPGKESE